MASNDHGPGSGALASRPARQSPFLVRLAACAVFATAFAVAAVPGAAADDLRVMGRLALSLGSGEWSLGIRADTDAWELQRTGEFGSPQRPAVDFTARFSGPGADFESLLLNGLPVAVRSPVLHADGSGEPVPGMRWEYVALGLAGAAVLVVVLRETLVDDFADDLGDAIEGIIDGDGDGGN